MTISNLKLSRLSKTDVEYFPLSIVISKSKYDSVVHVHAFSVEVLIKSASTSQVQYLYMYIHTILSDSCNTLNGLVLVIAGSNPVQWQIADCSSHTMYHSRYELQTCVHMYVYPVSSD